jgi:diguanylate cyclase (GGDEF)-like protein
VVLVEKPDVLHDVLDALPDATVLARALRNDDGRAVDLEVVWMNAIARSHLGIDVTTGARASSSDPWQRDGLLARSLAVLDYGKPDADEVVITDDDDMPTGFNWRAIRVEDDLLLWVQRDIGTALRSRHHLAAAEARLRAALAQSFDGHAFFHHTDGSWSVTWANEEFNRLDTDGKLTADIRGMVARVHESGRRVSELVPVAGRIFEVRLYPVEHEVAATVADQTEIFSTTAGLVWDVSHDPLTGIGNRSKLQQDLATALSKGGAATVLCLDLDGFKEVNDTMGHPAGDEVLRAIATRIASALRDGEEAYRLGGDEFVVIAGPLGQVAATALAERISAMVIEPVPTAKGPASVSVSIGVTIGTVSESTKGIIERADKALYEAKRGDKVVVFS